MTRYNQTTRKILKRKRTKDTNNILQTAPQQSGGILKQQKPQDKPGQMTQPSTTQKSKQKERNKRRKTKYKLKKKNQARKTKPQPPKLYTARSRRHWSQQVLSTSQLSLQQKRKLFLINNLCNIMEQNLAKIFNLKAKIFTSTFKSKTSVITSTTESSSANLTDIQTSITDLETENEQIKIRITSIKKSTNQLHKANVNQILRINRNHGHTLQKRINNLNSQHRYLNHSINQRLQLCYTNLANILEMEEKLQRKLLIEMEKEKLTSTNKIHNFTDITLSTDLINLLNKGTNFIPTSELANISNLSNTITTEVNSALNQVIRKGTLTNSRFKAKSSSKNNHRYKPYSKQNPIKLLQDQQNRPNFNLHIIDYVHNTTAYTKQYLHSTNLHSHLQPQCINTTPSQSNHIHNINTHTDIILTKTDKNMGWALVPISWFTNEYARHFTDTTTYRRIDNFNLQNTITKSNKLLRKLKTRFDKLIETPSDKHLLNTTTPDKLQLPYMKLLPKVHKLDNTASPSNINKLTGRPIITAHSWTTSNPSRLLGTELDKIILQLKDLFTERDIPFPLIYNSTDLLDLLHDFNIDNIDNYTLTTFDFTSLYTNISYSNTINAIITSCNLLNLSTFYRDFLLNLNNFINERNFFISGNDIFQQTKGVAMGSYHSRQIADLVLLLSELTFFTNYNTTGLFIFCRYIDDGFMFTDNTHLSEHITNLSSTYPTQIPITFTSSHHSVHYLDLTISLNHYTIRYHKIHHHIFQKPHHKYMYPHYSSNHPHHIFTGIIKTETVRYSRLSTAIDDYNFIRDLFTLRLTALDYPHKLITDNSFPWLPYPTHRRRMTNKKQRIIQNDKPTVYYRCKYNKHARTDKIVRHILHKYHNLRIPKLTKAYCNTTKLHTMLLTNKMLHSKIVHSHHNN